MKASLRTKLTLAFILLALTLILVISLMANLLLERQFTAYVIGKQEQRNEDIVALVSASYQDWGKTWDADGIDTIGANALLDGLILRFADGSGQMLWDARIHNDGMCTAILDHMAMNMQEHSPGFQGGYEELSYPVQSDGQKVGTITIGYYGPYFFSDHDLQFLGTLNRLLLWTAGVAFLVCLIVGAWMGQRISRPITAVIRTTEQIASGNFSDRAVNYSQTKEIVELTDAVNQMAFSLENQEQIRRRLTTDVAHELRTPIANLQSHLEAMIDGVWPADAKRLQSCHEETTRLARLVGDLELLTRFESEMPGLAIAQFDLDELIRRLLPNFESDLHLKKISLTYQGDSQLIEGDKDKLSQVMINLLSNALKYTDEGGQVCVSLEGTTEQVTVGIEDTGIGIAELDLPHVFDRFYRADQSRDRQTGGSGIGLTIARAIVTAHHGTLTVRSEIGKGSLFTVTLPRKQSTM